MKFDRKYIWPKFNSLEDAKRACKHGSIVSFIIAGITLTISLLSLTGASFFDEVGIDIYNLLDAMFYLVVGIFILKSSRIASILGIGVYSYDKISNYISGDFSGSLLTVIFILYFIGAVRGSFYYHKHNPTVKKLSKVSKTIITVITLLALSFIALLFLMEDNDDVYNSTTLSKERYQEISALDILSENENINLIYSDAFFTFSNSFILLTNKNLIMYDSSWEEKNLSKSITTISSVDVLQDYTDDLSTVFEVSFDDDNVFTFPITTTNEGDKLFLAELKKILADNSDLEEPMTYE